ncbi:hypothetical protein [Actinomadura sp. CNU-125]|nr:hypothetical protein [Actinomadura sp. CNU-125]
MQEIDAADFSAFRRGDGTHETVATVFEGDPFGEVWKRFCESVDTTRVAR